MAKMADDATHNTFRDRARQEYEERRAEGRLGPAQRTCVTLDEKAGKSVSELIFRDGWQLTFACNDHAVQRSLAEP
jgi:hypothetical protein